MSDVLMVFVNELVDYYVALMSVCVKCQVEVSNFKNKKNRSVVIRSGNNNIEHNNRVKIKLI